jgi:hypothetical protein
MRPPSVKQEFSGAVSAVKARVRLLRSFDQIHHAYQGYTLVIDGTLEGQPAEELRVGVGPKAHEKHQFRIGDQVTGLAAPARDPRTEWATHYKVSKLRVLERGPEEQSAPPNPNDRIAPPLPSYRAQGHRRLDKRTYSKSCQRCPFGLVMATEITIDHWDPDRKKWRFETHCYGPRDCRRYRPGTPYRVPGRRPDMVWVDDDVERENAYREYGADEA